MPFSQTVVCALFASFQLDWGVIMHGVTLLLAHSRAPSLRRTAFTLVELLVVIAIIGTLVGLLLPAVQAARESARQATCLNKLSQLSKGCLNYESARGMYPPAFTDVAFVNPNNTYIGNIYNTSNGQTGQSSFGTMPWTVRILPFIEDTQRYSKFRQDSPFGGDYGNYPGLCNVSSVNHRYGPDRSERSELRAGPYRLPG